MLGPVVEIPHYARHLFCALKPAVDKSVERVQTKLASMLNRLELEIQSVEKRIGDKMHVLDRDSDGMVSAEEIAHVVQHVLATESTAREAKAIAEDVSMCFCFRRFYSA